MQNRHIIMKLVYVILAFVALVSAELKAPDVTEIELLKDVDINKIVDRFTPNISQSIIKNGLDPLSLPNIEKKFRLILPILPLLYRPRIIMKEGKLKDLSHLKRYGNASLAYENKLVNVQAGVEFKDLQAEYDYTIKNIFISISSGRITASTKNVRAKISVSFNTTDYTLALNKFALENLGRIKVDVKTNSKWTIWRGKMIAGITNIFLPLFKNMITKAINMETANAIRALFAEVNKKTPFEVMAYAFENDILRWD